MGRRRKHNRDLPERVYPRGRQIVYVPYGQTKYIVLSKSLNRAEALSNYAKLLQGLQDRIPRTIADCMDDYLRSPQFARLAPRTQTDYQRDIARLRPIFGHMPPRDLAPSDIYQYLYTRPLTRGRLEIAALRGALNMAIRAGLIDRDPCEGIRYDPAPKRTRLPSPVEIASFYAQATPQIALYCRLKLMTGLRLGDMLRLDRRMIGDEGLTVTPGKTASRTGKTQLFLFVDDDGKSTGLRELLDEILSLPRRVTALALFATREGQHYTTDGWQSIWQRYMRAYVAAGGERFREHDIRATAGERQERIAGRESARMLLGHDLESTTARYTGRRKVVKIVPAK